MMNIGRGSYLPRYAVEFKAGAGLSSLNATNAWAEAKRSMESAAKADM